MYVCMHVCVIACEDVHVRMRAVVLNPISMLHFGPWSMVTLFLTTSHKQFVCLCRENDL